jgi:hypothetical protein
MFGTSSVPAFSYQKSTVQQFKACFTAAATIDLTRHVLRRLNCSVLDSVGYNQGQSLPRIQ